jgi:high-affinity nickel permease
VPLEQGAQRAFGILMPGGYGWAFVKPICKRCDSMTITFVSVIVAC